MSVHFLLRVAATLLFAAAAAALCLALHTPLPWMIGPLLAVSVASIAGLPTASFTPLRNLGQWVIGSALGLYFTPQVMALVGGIWWAIDWPSSTRWRWVGCSDSGSGGSTPTGCLPCHHLR